ncbi:MAG: AAA family ATPase [Mesorhizobium sp.]|nr:AAA family ATPase [Mesorhizobium sp.]MBL8578360.1 AAA family ATPase [Mesorhizobium sp.]
MSTDIKHDLDSTIAFLEQFQTGGPWNVTSIHPDVPGKVISATFSDPVKARAWLERHADTNLYFASASAPKPSGKGGRVTKPDIPFIEYIHGDLDVDKDDNALTLDQRKARKRAELDASEVPPTFTIDSGGGLAVLMRLDEPLEATPENIERVEAMNRWMVERFGADKQTTDVGRLLRLPGTVNYPSQKKRDRGRVVAPTKLLDSSGQLHDVTAFGQVARGATSNSMTDAECSAVEIVAVESLEDYGLPDDLRTLIVNGHEAGEDRSARMFHAACEMVRSGMPVGAVAGVLLNTEWRIGDHVRDHKGRPVETYAARQALRALRAVNEQRLADLQEMGGIEAEWLEGDGPVSGDTMLDGLGYVLASDVEMKPLNPLWPERFYIGKLSNLAGMPDMGKSHVTVDIAARVTTGAAWPDGSGFAPKGMAVFLAAEDDRADTIAPRLKAAGADMTKVIILNSLVLAAGKDGKKRRRAFSIAEDLDRLTRLKRQFPDIRVITIDPVNAFIGTTKETDSFRDTDVRAVLGPLKEWAEEHQVAIIIVTHFKKGGQGRAIDQVMGSLAFTALARSSWAFIEERDSNDEPTGRRLLAKIKQNVTRADVEAMACTIEGVDLGHDILTSRIVWDGKVEGNADMLLGGTGGSEKLKAAKAFLLAMLSDGPIAAATVLSEGELAGHSATTVRRAKKELGVAAVKQDGHWVWEITGTEVPAI